MTKKLHITNQDIKEQYGESVEYVFKENEPFVLGPNGAPMGVLLEKDNKVLCHECGEWFELLGSHLKLHKMSARQYRMKYGFNLLSPLCSKEYSRKRSDLAESGNYLDRLLEAQKNMTPEQLSARALRSSKRRMKNVETGITRRTKSIQFKNGKNICDEQLKTRLQYVKDIYGEGFGFNDVKRVDFALVTALVRRYGTFNKAKKAIGHKTNKKLERIGAGKLIHALRKYVRDHSETPWKGSSKARKNGFPYSAQAYKTEFGSLNRAYLDCGVLKAGSYTGSAKLIT